MKQNESLRMLTTKQNESLVEEFKKMEANGLSRDECILALETAIHLNVALQEVTNTKGIIVDGNFMESLRNLLRNCFGWKI